MEIRCVSPTLCLNEQMSKASLRRSISLSKQEKKMENMNVSQHNSQLSLNKIYEQDDDEIMVSVEKTTLHKGTNRNNTNSSHRIHSKQIIQEDETQKSMKNNLIRLKNMHKSKNWSSQLSNKGTDSLPKSLKSQNQRMEMNYFYV